MIVFALTAVGLALVLFGFVLGVLYERSYPAPIVEPRPPLTFPIPRKPSTLRLVQLPFDQDRCARAPFSVVPSEEAR